MKKNARVTRAESDKGRLINIILTLITKHNRSLEHFLASITSAGGSGAFYLGVTQSHFYIK